MLNSSLAGLVRQEPRASRSGWFRLSQVSVAVVLIAVFGLLPESASGNSYTGLLYGGTLNITSNSHSESGGYVYGAASWAAPPNVQFDGFAYTSGAFSSVSDNSVGGVSAGFGGDGSANQPTILFPWTHDCSITNSGHYWTNTSGTTLAGTNGRQTCNTTGNNSGWNTDSSELYNTNPGANPQSTYHTLWLTVFCQAATCNYDPNNGWGPGAVSVTNLSGSFVDPNSQPVGGAAWGAAVYSGYWYQTNGGEVTLDASASDPAGVCSMSAMLSGASTITSGVLGNATPGVTDVGGPIGVEFSSGTDPCWAGTPDTGQWTLPGSLVSGTYDLRIFASNPGNYESQGFSAANSPTVAYYGNAINVDDTVPSISWGRVPTGWTSATSQELQVTAGPSGLAAISCSDNGRSVSTSLVSGSVVGAGTTVWAVPTAVIGANTVSCTATNGDANGALVGSGSQVFDVDTTVPTISYRDAGYVEGTWTNSVQTVQIAATGGPSGIYNVACSVDHQAEQQLAGPSGGDLVVGGNGRHTVECTATSNTHVAGSATFTVNIDTEQPSIAFLVDGSPPSGGWLSGTPVVTVVGSEAGGILSGLSQISCSVNGGPAFNLAGIDAGTSYTGSFELDRNGADAVSCVGTTVAGTVEAVPAAATVNVDNPNYAPNPSSLIDGGADPYSAGPSQSQWYVTPQSVTITADNTGGSAPIAAISCKGAASGTWPASNLNTDAHGGEQVKVSVPAPGGDLSCTAEDSAGNVYVLGSYLFQIDDTAPTGYFVPRARWARPDQIEIRASDHGGSGVTVVRVYGQSPDVEQGKPQLVGDARYDAASGDYVVSVPDGVAPWVAGSWRFYANDVDAAGNQGQITSGADGSSETLTLPLRENTAVTAFADQVSAVPEAAIPAPLAAVAALSRSTRAAREPHGSEAVGRIASAGDRRARPMSGHNLTVGFAQSIVVAGHLRDVTHHGVPISGARILIYQQLVGARAYKRIGATRTNAEGFYRYRVRPGASRTLYVMYPGSDLLRPAASALQELSGGSVSIHASAIRSGQRLLLAGVVRGGHIPEGGLEVTIDYRQLGAPGSGTLGTVRTDRRGRYRFSQYFSPRTRGLTYELWAVVSRGQAGWPFTGAQTRRLVRRVA